MEHPDLSVQTVNAPQPTFHGIPPICIAAWLGSADACQILLESDKVYVDARDLSGATALMCTSKLWLRYYHSLILCQYLLDAAREGIPSVIEVLVRTKAMAGCMQTFKPHLLARV